MSNNDILRSLRYILNVRDAKLAEICALAQVRVSASDMTDYLKDEEAEGFRPCPDEVLGSFLNGLVVLKRGVDPKHPIEPFQGRITNNLVLKKLRVAFELKDTDLIALIEKSGTLKVSKGELSAFFRNPDHRNYRPCGDQYLRNLLKALA